MPPGTILFRDIFVVDTACMSVRTPEVGVSYTVVGTDNCMVDDAGSVVMEVHGDGTEFGGHAELSGEYFEVSYTLGIRGGGSGSYQGNTGIRFNYQDFSNHWYIRTQNVNQGVYLRKVVAGVDTLIEYVAGGGTYYTTWQMIVEVRNSTIKIWRGGSLIIDYDHGGDRDFIASGTTRLTNFAYLGKLINLFEVEQL